MKALDEIDPSKTILLDSARGTLCGGGGTWELKVGPRWGAIFRMTPVLACADRKMTGPKTNLTASALLGCRRRRLDRRRLS